MNYGLALSFKSKLSICLLTFYTPVPTYWHAICPLLRKNKGTQYIMKHFFIGLMFVFILITTFSALLAGTSGAIQGIILDVETQKPLQSVNIILVGTKMGAVSKEDGTFRIDNLSSGSYGLNASIIGYDKGYKLDVNVVPNIGAWRSDFVLHRSAGSSCNR